MGFLSDREFLWLFNWKSKKVTSKASEGSMLGDGWSHQQDVDTESDQFYSGKQ